MTESILWQLRMQNNAMDKIIFVKRYICMLTYVMYWKCSVCVHSKFDLNALISFYICFFLSLRNLFFRWHFYYLSCYIYYKCYDGDDTHTEWKKFKKTTSRKKNQIKVMCITLKRMYKFGVHLKLFAYIPNMI